MLERDTDIVIRQANCQRASIVDKMRRFHVTPSRDTTKGHINGHRGRLLMSESAGIDYGSGELVPIGVGQDKYSEAVNSGVYGQLPAMMNLFPMHHYHADALLERELNMGLFDRLAEEGILAIGHIAVYVGNRPTVIDFSIPAGLVTIATERADSGRALYYAKNIAIASLRRAFKVA